MSSEQGASSHRPRSLPPAPADIPASSAKTRNAATREPPEDTLTVRPRLRRFARREYGRRREQPLVLRSYSAATRSCPTRSKVRVASDHRHPQPPEAPQPPPAARNGLRPANPAQTLGTPGSIDRAGSDPIAPTRFTQEPPTNAGLSTREADALALDDVRERGRSRVGRLLLAGEAGAPASSLVRLAGRPELGVRRHVGHSSSSA